MNWLLLYLVALIAYAWPDLTAWLGFGWAVVVAWVMVSGPFALIIARCLRYEPRL